MKTVPPHTGLLHISEELCFRNRPRTGARAMTTYVFLLSHNPTLSGNHWCVTWWACVFSAHAACLDHLFLFPGFRLMCRDADSRGYIEAQAAEPQLPFISFIHCSLLIKQPNRGLCCETSAMRPLCNSLTCISESTWHKNPLLSSSWVTVNPVEPLGPPLSDFLLFSFTFK